RVDALAGEGRERHEHGLVRRPLCRGPPRQTAEQGEHLRHEDQRPRGAGGAQRRPDDDDEQEQPDEGSGPRPVGDEVPQRPRDGDGAPHREQRLQPPAAAQGLHPGVVHRRTTGTSERSPPRPWVAAPQASATVSPSRTVMVRQPAAVKSEVRSVPSSDREPAKEAVSSTRATPRLPGARIARVASSASGSLSATRATTTAPSAVSACASRRSGASRSAVGWTTARERSTEGRWVTAGSPAPTTWTAYPSSARCTATEATALTAHSKAAPARW